MNGGALPPALAAKWLADAWDQNAALYVMSPVASKLESVCEAWLRICWGCRRSAWRASWAAPPRPPPWASPRPPGAAARRQGWDVQRAGSVRARPPIRVVMGEEAHGTVFKALALLGLGRERVERVPVDGPGRMRAEPCPRWTTAPSCWPRPGT